MGVPVIDTGPMTVEEFYDFTDSRPDGEKWELIDGEAVLNASPSPIHQWIAGNIMSALSSRQRERSLPWRAVPGGGVRVSDITRPEPDVMIIPNIAPRLGSTSRDTGDALVLFEITSPSTKGRDLKWKRAAYTNIPSLTHYVVVAQDAVDVVVFARENGFAEQRLASLDEAIVFPALGVSLPLAEIYLDLEFT